MERKIGVIGDWESIVGFRALGLDVKEALDAETAEAILKAWTEEGYAVIFVTEALAESLGPRLSDWQLRYLPAVIIIPSARRPSYFGRQELRTAVRKATGIDLLGQREKNRRDA
ncbi:MAG: V-type ATP synthase subunit F [Saccharofermentanales bacterium]|jgi:V/A-type H+-transporting ATPase subunit F